MLRALALIDYTFLNDLHRLTIAIFELQSVSSTILARVKYGKVGHRGDAFLDAVVYGLSLNSIVLSIKSLGVFLLIVIKGLLHANFDSLLHHLDIMTIVLLIERPFFMRLDTTA